jgi:hypothetical protein
MSPNTKRKNWSKEAMCRAAIVVRSGEMGYLRASKYFSVPKGILERYLKNTSDSPEDLVNVNLETRFVSPSELENQFVEYCILVIMDQRYLD